MKKILMINAVPTERNGITGVIFNIIRSINADGLTIDLLSLNEPDRVYYEYIERCHGRIFVTPSRRGRIFGYLGYAARLIKREGYDIVHIHGNSHGLMLELLAAIIAGCRVRIIHAHSTGGNIMTLHKLLSPLFSLMYTDGFACGVDAGRFMFGRKSFTVFNNAIDSECFRFDKDARDSVRSSLGIGEGTVLIGHVGGFMEPKNQSFLIDVFNELVRTDGEKYRLLLVGDGPLYNEVREKAAALGLDNKAIFAGAVDNVTELLSAMDVIVMPSRFEGLPLTLIEEQAAGLKCIVSDAVTREADKTGLISFIPLSMGPAGWADTVRRTELPRNRAETSEGCIKAIREAGYDITEQTEKLARFYLER